MVSLCAHEIRRILKLTACLATGRSLTGSSRALVLSLALSLALCLSLSLALSLAILGLLVVGLLSILALGGIALSCLALSCLALSGVSLSLLVLASSRGFTRAGSALLGLALSALLLPSGRISGIVVVSGTRSGTSKQARESGEKVPFLQGVLAVGKNVTDGMLAAADMDGSVVGGHGRAHDESRQDGMLPREFCVDKHSDCVDLKAEVLSKDRKK